MGSGGGCAICGKMDHWKNECPSNPAGVKGASKGGGGGKASGGKGGGGKQGGGKGGKQQQVCRNHKVGRCEYGSACHFLHETGVKKEEGT